MCGHCAGTVVGTVWALSGHCVGMVLRQPCQVLAHRSTLAHMARRRKCQEQKRTATDSQLLHRTVLHRSMFPSCEAPEQHWKQAARSIRSFGFKSNGLFLLDVMLSHAASRPSPPSASRGLAIRMPLKRALAIKAIRERDKNRSDAKAKPCGSICSIFPPLRLIFKDAHDADISVLSFCRF